MSIPLTVATVLKKHVTLELECLDRMYLSGYVPGLQRGRMQSEVLTLDRRHLDLDAGILRLDPSMTKNDDGRLCYLPPDLKAQLAAQVERVDHLSRKLGRIIPWLFPHLKGPHRGERRREFVYVWRRACREAGAPGMLRHDLRRTAVRNLVHAGVSERVAMKISGHKTRDVFDRYHIVSPADLLDAARRIHGPFWAQ
jgi:integrase